MSPGVTVDLSPRRDGRWRARVTGSDPDGSQRVVVVDLWDRDAAVTEGVIAWYAAAPRAS